MAAHVGRWAKDDRQALRTWLVSLKSPHDPSEMGYRGPPGSPSCPRSPPVMVPRQPSDAGIDPYVVLIDLERFDNVEEVEIER